MAIPDNNGTGTSADWSIQTVVDEINPTTDDLRDCFFDSNTSLFNTTYQPNSTGSYNNLLNFRDYDGTTPSLKIFFATASNYTTATIACTNTNVNLGGMTVLYFSGTGAAPAIGDTVYYYPAGTVPLSGGGLGKWWGSFVGNIANSFRANSSGVITHLTPCTPSPGCLLGGTVDGTTKPNNYTDDNGTLTVSFVALWGTLTYSLDGGTTWVTPSIQLSPLVVTGLSSGSGTILLAGSGGWNCVTPALAYTVPAATYNVYPTYVMSSTSPWLYIAGTSGAISSQVVNTLGNIVLTSTANPIDVSSLANNGEMWIRTWQTSPAVVFGPDTFAVFQ